MVPGGPVQEVREARVDPEAPAPAARVVLGVPVRADQEAKAVPEVPEVPVAKEVPAAREVPAGRAREAPAALRRLRRSSWGSKAPVYDSRYCRTSVFVFPLFFWCDFFGPVPRCRPGKLRRVLRRVL